MSRLNKNFFNDRYEFINEIPGGRTSHIFVCRDTKFEKKKVILKILKNQNRQIPGVNSRELAKSEISRLDVLDHPNICKIIDFFIDEEWGIVLVLPFLKGLTLQELPRPLTKSETVEIIKQILNALSYMHSPEVNVRHQDLKPSNIFITRHENQITATLLDFGLVGNMGTPKYAAPEVLNDVLGFEPGPPADMWSLAIIILYDLPKASFLATLAKEILKHNAPWKRLTAPEIIKSIESRTKRIHLFSRALTLASFIPLSILFFYLISSRGQSDLPDYYYPIPNKIRVDLYQAFIVPIIASDVNGQPPLNLSFPEGYERIPLEIGFNLKGGTQEIQRKKLALYFDDLIAKANIKLEMQHHDKRLVWSYDKRKREVIVSDRPH